MALQKGISASYFTLAFLNQFRIFQTQRKKIKKKLAELTETETKPKLYAPLGFQILKVYRGWCHLPRGGVCRKRGPDGTLELPKDKPKMRDRSKEMMLNSRHPPKWT